MHEVTPTVTLIARPAIDWDGLSTALDDLGADAWTGRSCRDPELLVEVAGRVCYRSFSLEGNANLTRVRRDLAAYLDNLLASRHGSVLEHASFTFLVHQVSRAVTHELVRHRAGTAFSEESRRYVRVTDIGMWVPPWFFSTEWGASEEEVAELADLARHIVTKAELLSAKVGTILDRRGADFAAKKRVTAAARRWSPEGAATTLVLSANARALRHIVESRTDVAAEEEMRLVAGQIAEIMRLECPLLFGDYTVADGAWTTPNRKV